MIRTEKPQHTNPVRLTSPGGTPAIEGGHPVRSVPLAFSPPDIRDEEIEAVTEVLRSGWITTGSACREFESMLAQYTGAPHAVVLSSATAGLFLLLKTMGIGDGDEVITTPYTFAATANVILHAGATPVFADIEEDTLNISPEQIKRSVTPKTKALIPVHLAGNPVDVKTIREIAEFYGIAVIEDAAHAIGASVHGKKIGDGKHPAAFSFHAVKNLTTGEGGAVTATDERLIREIRLLSLHGQSRDGFSKSKEGGWKYDILAPGYKLNMTDMQAALGICQLRRLDRNREKREAIAREYTVFLSGFDFISIPHALERAVHARHLFPMLVDFDRLSVDRDTFIRGLWAENIQANVHYIPVHTMSYYRNTFGYEPYDFPVAYSSYLKEVSLPIYPKMRDSDVNDVIEALSRLFARYKK